MSTEISHAFQAGQHYYQHPKPCFSPPMVEIMDIKLSVQTAQQAWLLGLFAALQTADQPPEMMLLTDCDPIAGLFEYTMPYQCEKLSETQLANFVTALPDLQYIIQNSKLSPFQQQQLNAALVEMQSLSKEAWNARFASIISK